MDAPREQRTMATQVGKLKTEETQGHGPSFVFYGFLARLGEYPRQARGFLHEVRVEMRQVTWPTRHEVFVTTWVVIVTVAFFGVFFFGVDSAASWIVQRAIKFFGH
jgi:preprotein translocase subunit SecE